MLRMGHPELRKGPPTGIHTIYDTLGKLFLALWPRGASRGWDLQLLGEVFNTGGMICFMTFKA